jgi:hypothetical protein
VGTNYRVLMPGYELLAKHLNLVGARLSRAALDGRLFTASNHCIKSH